MLRYFTYSPIKKQILLGLKARAGAKQNSISGFVEIEGKKYLKITIKVIAEQGKANNAIITFLAKEWLISKDNLKIVMGHTNNLKILSIKNTMPEYLNSILTHYMS